MIQVYIQSLDKDKQTQIVSQQGTNTYWFGDGQLAPAKSNIDTPIVLPDQHILLNIDIAYLYFFPIKQLKIQGWP